MLLLFTWREWNGRAAGLFAAAAAIVASPLVIGTLRDPLLLKRASTTWVWQPQDSLATRAGKVLARSDELCRRLMTVPGVGPVTAVRFKAALDEQSRFRDAHRVESYLGLVPGERSSSESQHRLGITKAGSTALRACLIQAAWAARRCKDTPLMVTWSLEVEKRRGKYVAVVALARKLVGVLFAIWRDGTRYDKTRA